MLYSSFTYEISAVNKLVSGCRKWKHTVADVSWGCT